MKKELRLTFIFLQPSWLSFIVTALATVTTIALVNWSYLAAIPELFDTFYGRLGIVTVVERSSTSIQDLENSIISSPVAYGVGLLALALAAGTVVYFIVHGTRRGLVTLWSTRRDSAIRRHERAQRALARFGILVIWFLYLLFTIYIAVPFCLLLWRISIEGIGGVEGIIASILVSVLLFFTLHVHTIFARLFFLRPRVFGGEAVTELALID